MYENLTKEQIAKKCYDLRTKNKRLTERVAQLNEAIEFQQATIKEQSEELQRIRTNSIWR